MYLVVAVLAPGAMVLVSVEVVALRWVAIHVARVSLPGHIDIAAYHRVGCL